jgi:hypothetical protein
MGMGVSRMAVLATLAMFVVVAARDHFHRDALDDAFGKIYIVDVAG